MAPNKQWPLVSYKPTWLFTLEYMLATREVCRRADGKVDLDEWEWLLDVFIEHEIGRA